jgi:hypothetical protein
MPRKFSRKETADELADRYIQEALAPAKEALEHVHHAILNLPEFTLRDGTKARIRTCNQWPTITDNGDLACDFNVNLDNGTDMTFNVAAAGWGKYIGPPPGESSRAAAIRKNPPRPRQR